MKFKEFFESINTTYSPPLSHKEVLNKYGEKLANKLLNDPIHKFRMETGIELLHQEPTIDEMKRIINNWKLMSTEQKAESDKKSIELFGKTNEERINELLALYEIDENMGGAPIGAMSSANFQQNVVLHDKMKIPAVARRESMKFQKDKKKYEI